MKLWLKIVLGVIGVLVIVAGGYIITHSGFGVDRNNLPQFIQADFVDLSKIYSISKFRSGEGHDFSGGGETCRSMKHYYTPQSDPSSAASLKDSNGLPPKPDGKTDIPIYSPVDGKIGSITEEHTPIGKQISITPTNAKQFNIRLFHIYPLDSIKRGTKVKAGQQIGVIGKDQGTDISVQIGGMPWNENYVSYFEVMPDSVFASYLARGAKLRDDFIFTKEYRDTRPFVCGGDHNEMFQHASDYDTDANNVHLSGYVASSYKTTQKDQSSSSNTQNSSSSSQSTSNTPSAVQWMRMQNGWAAQGTPPKCSDPITVQSPVKIDLATAILYPGQYRGSNYKPHGGFLFGNSKNEDITVTVPLDAYLTKASRYIEQGETQTFLVFIAPCGIMYRLDHLLTLAPKYQAIIDTLPAAKVDDSSTTDINPPVQVTAGEVVATAVGFKKNNNVSVDFGLYDIRQKNEISENAAWAAKHADDNEFAPYALCFLDQLPSADAAKAKALPGGDSQAGKTSDYCK